MNQSARDVPLLMTIEVDPRLPGVLVGDALRLQQVLVNLAGNAIKFTPQGRVEVRLSQAGRTGEVIDMRIEVEDTGIGMTAEQMDRLFAAFTQADTSTTRRFGGTGLGLTISRRLAELMGGTITVTSVEGQGSKFSVMLQLAAGAEGPSSPPEGAGMRVLVIDEDGASGVVAEAALRMLGCRTIVARSVLAAVALGEGCRCELVLLDARLADHALTEQIRTLVAATGGAVAVMASAFERAHFDSEPTNCGAIEVIDKPLTIAPLRACLQALQPRAAEAPAVTAAPAATAARCRLLLVEDNPLNQVVARRMLEAAGASIDIAGDGSVAVALLREHPQAYDLVLLDIQMPVMDGFETIAQIRGPLGLHLPVLAMSAGVMEHEQARCLAAGMNGFIAKPVEAQQMFAEIGKHLPPEASLSMAPPRAPSRIFEGVFDLQGLIKSMGGEQASGAMLAGLVRDLVERGTEVLTPLPQWWREGRREEAARALHTLRGSIGTLGAARFAQACLLLEQALKQDGVDDAMLDGLHLRVRSELEATLAAAGTWLDARAQPDAAAAPVFEPGHLATLARLLGERNLAACEEFDRLAPGLVRLAAGDAMARLRQAMAVLDFETAGMELQQIVTAASGKMVAPM
jgi:CheY-like chemotaxis protein